MAYRRTPLMQERIADTRHRILLATRKLIARGGFRAAAISSVAREAGLSTGAIYRYFPSKSDLFVEVLTSAVDHEVAILLEIAGSTGKPVDRLRAAVESFANRALEGPHLAYAFIAEPTDPEVEAARITCRGQFADVFRGILQSGIDAGDFPDQAADITAACLVGAFTEALIRPVAAGTKPSGGPLLTKAIANFCVRAAIGGPRRTTAAASAKPRRMRR